MPWVLPHSGQRSGRFRRTGLFGRRLFQPGEEVSTLAVEGMRRSAIVPSVTFPHARLDEPV